MKFKRNYTGEYLRNLRKVKGYTIREVADKLNVSAGYMSRIENNTSTPSMELLKKMCMIYSIDIDEIIDIEEEDVVEEQPVIYDLNKFVLNNDIYYNGLLLGNNDKIMLLQFADFITKCDNEFLKENAINIIGTLKNSWLETR